MDEDNAIRNKISKIDEYTYYFTSTPDTFEIRSKLRTMDGANDTATAPDQQTDGPKCISNLVQQNRLNAKYKVATPPAPYEQKRSSSLLKVKGSLDTDGVVVELLEGKGKYVGMLGKVRLMLGSGKTVLVGTGFSDKQRKDFWNKSFLGTTITIKFMTLTNSGIPRQPVFDRIRYDSGI